MSDLKLAALAILILIVVVFLWFVGGIINGDLRCFQTADGRPCIKDTIQSNSPGKCKCMTTHGDLEWTIFPTTGCDLS